MDDETVHYTHWYTQCLWVIQDNVMTCYQIRGCRQTAYWRFPGTHIYPLIFGFTEIDIQILLQRPNIWSSHHKSNISVMLSKHCFNYVLNFKTFRCYWHFPYDAFHYGSSNQFYYRMKFCRIEKGSTIVLRASTPKLSSRSVLQCTLLQAYSCEAYY